MGARDQLHPLAMVSSRHWWRLLRSSGGVDPACRWRAAAITAATPLLSAVRLAERAIYGRRIDAVTIAEPPVFILGH